MIVACASPGLVSLGKVHISSNSNSSSSSGISNGYVNINYSAASMQSAIKRTIDSTGTNRNPSNDDTDNNNDDHADMRGGTKKRVRIDENINVTQEVPSREPVTDRDSVKDHYNQLSRKEVKTIVNYIIQQQIDIFILFYSNYSLL